jgi:hypothetical protein
MRIWRGFQLTAEQHDSLAHADQSLSAAICAHLRRNGDTCGRTVVADLDVEVVV